MKKASKRNISFIVVSIFLILASRCGAQGRLQGKDFLLPGRLVFPAVNDSGGFGQEIAKTIEAKPVLSLRASLPLPVLSADYYVRNFGFFCKQEWEFEKKTGIPLKFRLGSLAYCNKLEGK